jgi:acyl-CoA synthetase (AMP-forming)/AMP-acid ligase II
MGLELVTLCGVTKLAMIEAGLTQPGGMFEVIEENLHGTTTQVFRHRAPHLRALLERSLQFERRTYLVFGDERWSYREHFHQVCAAARVLETQFGVRPGDRVAIAAANQPWWIVAFWAATSLGATVVAINAWWTKDEMSYALEHSGACLVLADSKRLARLEGSLLSLPKVEIAEEFPKLCQAIGKATLPQVPLQENDPVVMLYTSGTTGNPKGVVHSHRNLTSLLGALFFHGARVHAWSGQTSGGIPVLLSANPLFHVSGLHAGAVTHLAAGATSIWMKGKFDPKQTLEIIQKEKVTGWSPHGSMAYRVLNHPERDSFDVSSVRTIGTGGAPVAETIFHRLRTSFPTAAQGMAIGYGLTEFTALATMNFGQELIDFPESSGRLMPTVELEIRDEQGRKVPDGEYGEICLRGPLVMVGYWKDPEATKRAIRKDGWLHTGDIGRFEDGRLYLAARQRDLILRGAENVYPVEIEQKIVEFPGVAECAVVGVPSEEFGQEVKAVVVPVPGHEVDVVALQSWIAGKIAYYKVPTYWEVRNQPLPRNATGKVMKFLVADGLETPFLSDE